MSPRTHYLIKLDLPDTYNRDRAVLTMFCVIATVLVFAGFLFLTTGLIDVINGGAAADINQGLFYGILSLALGAGMFMIAFLYIYNQNVK